MTGPWNAEQQLEQSYPNLRSALTRFLSKQVDNIDVAEDLTQEVFVKALRAIQQQRAPDNLSAWLYQAARTTLVDYWRRQPGQTQPLSEEWPAEDDDDTGLLHYALARCLRPMTEELPDLYREALIAVDFEGWPIKTLTENEGVSLSAIKSRVSRGRAMLREQVLACCHVEMADGWVQDFHPHAQPATCNR